MNDYGIRIQKLLHGTENNYRITEQSPVVRKSLQILDQRGTTIQHDNSRL